jgi:hypothetical protein
MQCALMFRPRPRLVRLPVRVADVRGGVLFDRISNGAADAGLKAGTKGRRLSIFALERLAVPAALPAKFDATVADEKDFAATDLLAKQRVTRSCNMQQFSKRGIGCRANGRISFIARKRWGLPRHKNLFIWTRTHGQDAHATGTRFYRGVSTLIGWSKNVRKRKISKVDRDFQGVARGSGLRIFFSGPFVGICHGGQKRAGRMQIDAKSGPNRHSDVKQRAFPAERDMPQVVWSSAPAHDLASALKSIISYACSKNSPSYAKNRHSLARGQRGHFDKLSTGGRGL